VALLQAGDLVPLGSRAWVRVVIQEVALDVTELADSDGVAKVSLHVSFETLGERGQRERLVDGGEEFELDEARGGGVGRVRKWEARASVWNRRNEGGGREPVYRDERE